MLLLQRSLKTTVFILFSFCVCVRVLFVSLSFFCCFLQIWCSQVGAVSLKLNCSIYSSLLLKWTVSCCKEVSKIFRNFASITREWAEAIKVNISSLFVSLSLFVNASRCQRESKQRFHEIFYLMLCRSLLLSVSFAVWPSFAVWVHLCFTTVFTNSKLETIYSHNQFATFQELSGFHIIVYFIIIICESYSF